MVLFEWFVALPLWIRIVIGIPLIVWAIEVFILPFKFNILCRRYNKSLELLEAILSASKLNTKAFDGTQQIMNLLLGIISTRGKQNGVKDNKEDGENKDD